jgi:hypothetical protein
VACGKANPKQKASPEAGLAACGHAVVQGLVAVEGFAGVIFADSAFTLGGLVAVPGGECAPEVSSGFCVAGV